MTKRLMQLVLAVLLVVLSAGCHRRPLVDMEEKIAIRVEVNIKAIANVTADIYNEHIPVPDLSTDMMRVMVYDTDTKNLLTQSFISNKSYNEDGSQVFSGDLNISYGTYDFLVYNFDTPTTQVSYEQNENSILAYTEDISPAMRSSFLNMTKDGQDDVNDNNLYEDLEIIYEPDHLVVAREKDLRVSPHDTVVVISTVATTIIDTYYLQIRVKNMQYASSATAVISGLSPSNKFGLNQRTQNPATGECFNLYKSTDERITSGNKDVLCALFNTFGKIPEATSDLYVTFNVVDTGGNLQQKTVNLDTVFQTEDAIKRHWLLIDLEWELQPPQNQETSTSGGFQPRVDDWEQEQGTIVL